MPNLATQFLRTALCSAGIAFAAAAQAVPVTGLYDVSVPVENRSDKARDSAFADAMAAVAVRISGQRDAGQKLGTVLPQARKYVQRYGYPAAGTLQVGFDGNSFDQALSSAGLPIWGHERPATLVCVAIEDANGQRQWITGSGGATAEALTRTAADRGIPLLWPAMDREEQSRLDAMLNNGVNAQELASLGDRYRANAVLLGRVRRDGGAHWQIVYGPTAADANGGLSDGVHLAADTFASAFAVGTSSVNAVQVEVSGMSNLDAYAQTLNYLEGLTLVRTVSVEQVSGDTIQFRVAMRGDAATLRRLLQLDNRYAVEADDVTAGAAVPRVTLRYQP